MLFSVWNVPRRMYDYYESTGTVMPMSGPPAATHLRRPALGVSPERAAWPLPADARLVGHGPYARGAVASSGSASMDGALGGVFDGVPTWGWVAAGIGVLFYLGRRRR